MSLLGRMEVKIFSLLVMEVTSITFRFRNSSYQSEGLAQEHENRT